MKEGTWTVDCSVGAKTLSIKIRGASGFTTSLVNPTLAEDIGKVILRELGLRYPDDEDIDGPAPISVAGAGAARMLGVDVEPPGGEVQGE